MSQLRTNSLFENALKAEGVTGPMAQLARSIYSQESSGGRNTNTSNAGAVGGMQIIPSTFKSMADKGWDIKNPEHNARAGIRYIKNLAQKAGGDPWLTAVGYYSGEGGMNAARKGVARVDRRNPNAPNTFQYADSVVGRIGMSPMQQQVPTAGGTNLTIEDIWGPEEEAAVAEQAALSEGVPEAPVLPVGGGMEAFNAALSNNYASGLNGQTNRAIQSGAIGLGSISNMPDVPLYEPKQNFDMGIFKRT